MAAAKKKPAKGSTRRATRTSRPAPQEYIPYQQPYSQRSGTNPLLIILVIILAFFTGYLFFKVQNLEKTTGVGQTTQQLPQPPTAGTKVKVDTGHLPPLGDNNAKVIIIEFADFQCPFCAKLFTSVEPQLKKDYIDTGKVKFYFRHYAFLGQESTWAAEASECANEQGKFWDYHDFLYNHQGQENSGAFAKDKLEGFAQQIGLNSSQFNSCLESDKYAQKIKDDLSAGQTAGVQGTPTTFINGTLVDGARPYTDFKTVIDQALK